MRQLVFREPLKSTSFETRPPCYTQGGFFIAYRIKSGLFSVTMKIQDLQTDQIKPYSKNNRTHPEEQIKRIADSIKQFGFNQPIVIDENNQILVGHGRLLAAQKLGLKNCPTVVLKGLAEREKRAYRILDNKLQNDSAWEFGNLEFELSYLKDNDFDLEAWGLDKLLPGDVTPISAEDQSQLDEKEPTICPECGHAFHLKA